MGNCTVVSYAFPGKFLELFYGVLSPCLLSIEQRPCQPSRIHNIPKRYTYPHRQNKKLTSQNAPFTKSLGGKTDRTEMLDFVSSVKTRS